MTNRRRALVVGLGIAGMAAAKRLHEIGWDVTVIERSSGRRTGGYFIAMFHTGRISADRMGILSHIPNRTKANARTWEVTRGGRRRQGMSFATLPDGPLLVTRGDVEAALFHTLPDQVEVRFGTVPTRLVQHAEHVTVTMATSSPTETEESAEFDLVIGADGIRSTVRRLAFGPDANFIRDLDYMIAATLLDHDLTGFDRGDAAILSEPGRSASTFAFADIPPGVLFSYRVGNPRQELTKKPIDALRVAYGPEPTGPFLAELLDRYEAADDALFDLAQQVRMRQWHTGRVALIGDAAWCMTLYSGLGAASGIAGAELLGTLLRRQDHDPLSALPEWNRHIAPFVEYQHRTIDQSRAMFTSHDRAQHLQRKAMMRLLSLPSVSKLLGRTLSRSKAFQMKAIDIGAAA